MALVGGDFTTHMDGYADAHHKTHESNSTVLPLIGAPNSTKIPIPNRETLNRLHVLCKPEHRILIISAVTLAFTSAVQLCIPASTGLIIDSALFSDDLESKSIPILLLGLFFIKTFAAYLTYIRTVWQAKAGHDFTARIRKVVYDAILSQDQAYFDTTSQGDILSRLSSDADCMQVALTDQLMNFCRSTMMASGAAMLLLYTSWSLALVALTVLPPTMFLARRIGTKMKASHGTVQGLHATATSQAEQALTCIRTVQQFVAEPYESQAYSQSVQAAHTAAVDTARLQAQSSAWIEQMATASMLCVLGYGGSLVASKELSPGALAGFVMYSLIMAGNVSSLSGLYMDITKAIAALERLLEIIDRKPSIPPPTMNMDDWTPTAPTQSVRPMAVKFENVSFSYPARPNIKVLQNFSIDIKPGQVVALVGSSGAGKSTVASLLTRLYNTDEGTIFVDGTALQDLTPHSIRQSIGIVMQEPLLFPTSIADNIRYGNFHATSEQVLQAAKSANVWDFAHALPLGLDTVVGPRGTQLSGGQKQRVAVARCLLKNPSLVILDEATSALDAESEHAVQRAMDAACVGRTVLLIAHRLSSIQTADKIAVMRHGQLAEFGSFDELVQKPNGIFRQLVERQLAQDGSNKDLV